MRISILNKEFEFNSEEDSFENVIYTIFKETSKCNRFVDFLIIDGKSIKTNFVQYLEKHFKEVKNVKVVALSIKNSVLTSLIGFQDFVKEQLLSIDYITTNISDNEETESASQIDLLLEGIAIIAFQFEKLDRLNNLNELVPNYFLWNRLAVQIYKLVELSANIDQLASSGNIVELKSTIDNELIGILIEMDEILTAMLKYE